jgi:hypothetical protein
MESGRWLQTGEREHGRMELFSHYLQVGCRLVLFGCIFLKVLIFLNTVRDISIKTMIVLWHVIVTYKITTGVALGYVFNYEIYRCSRR